MIFDKQTLFSDAQAVTASAPSENVVQIGDGVNAPGDAGAGKPISLMIQVVETFNTLTSLDVAIQVDDNEDFTSAKTVMSVNIPVADLVVGKHIPPQFIPQGVDEAYVRLHYAVNGANPTLGRITAGVSMGNQTNG